MQNPDDYSHCHPAPNSPTLFVLLADAFDEELDVLETMSRADILNHPHARFATPEEAEDAHACWFDIED